MTDAAEIAALTRTPLARRGFVMTSLISGLTLATTRVDAQAIHTDTVGLSAGEARVPVADGGLPAYVARPDAAGPFPVVLVVEEIFGVHDYIKDICRRLAKQGYLAIAAEYYARVGDLSKMTAMAELSATVARAPDAQMLADMDAVAAWAGQNRGDAGRLGVTGFCRGGRQTWLFATHNPRLKAAVSWYGILGGKASANQPKSVLDSVIALKCPVRGLYGGHDAANPLSEVRQLEAEAKQDGGRRIGSARCRSGGGDRSRAGAEDPGSAELGRDRHACRRHRRPGAEPR
ncbi:MAG: dienelactone hydrolase family protein [Pseudomonadota bacterium]|nr:dienelactone hydrolase family protein [Pseudomonadota bacterium]